MSPKSKVNFSVKLPSEHVKIISEIIKRTGEQRTDLFQRLIVSEHKRINSGESIAEQSNAKLESVIKSLDEIIPIIKTTSEKTASIYLGTNKIYSAVLFVLKELFRTIHFITQTFAESSLLRKEQLTIIINNSNQEATISFDNINEILNKSKASEILSILKTK